MKREKCNLYHCECQSTPKPTALDAWKGFLDGQGVEWRIEDAKYLVDLAIKDFYGEWIVIARFNPDGSLYRGEPDIKEGEK